MNGEEKAVWRCPLLEGLLLHWMFPNEHSSPQHSLDIHSFIHPFIQGTFIFYVLYAGGPEDTAMDKGWVLTSTVYTHTHTHTHTQSRVRPMPALEPMGHKHNPELEGR